MLRPVIAVADAQRVDGAREAVMGVVDAAAVFARRDRYTTSWDDTGQAEWVHNIGADLVRGHARLDGVRRVAVSTPDNRIAVLSARLAVVVCTGSRAALPDLPGIVQARPWTNRAGTDSHQVPGRLAVVGGGPVGVEMATAWHGLGSSVTLLARTSRLLPLLEPFAGEMVADGLVRAGVDVRINTAVAELRRPVPTDSVVLVLEDGKEVEADEVLFATGREPNTADIGLDRVGLTPGGWLDVDDSCQVIGPNQEWLYAAGDVNHRALLTHQVDLDREVLLGVTFVGPGVAELVTSATMAVVGGLPIDRLWHAVPCFPTLSEIWLRLLEAYRD